MTTFQDVVRAFESQRKEMAMAGCGQYIMPHDEAYYRTRLQSEPEFFEEMLSTYQEQTEKASGMKQGYMLMDEELDAYSRAAVEAKEAVEVVEVEVVDTHPVIAAETAPVTYSNDTGRVSTYNENHFNFFSPPKPVQLPQYTAHDRKNHSIVTDDYDVVALVEDFQKKIPYVRHQGRVYIYFQVYEDDIESTAWIYQTHDDLVGRLNWFYKKELGKIGTTKIIREVARFIETDVTHTVRELDETKIKSRIQFLGRYYDLNRRQWFSNSHKDFFTIYIAARGVDVQFWDRKLEIYPQMLHNICQGSTATLCAVSEMLATSMSRTTEYKGAFVIAGPANSGKSALIHLAELFYPSHVKKHKSVQELMVDKELSELEGIALNTKEELSSTVFSPDETAFFKTLTSGDGTEVTSGKKYCNDVTFKLSCHHIFATNLEIRFSNYTQAVLNRVIYIGLDHEIPPEQRIRNLNEQLRTELPGILNSLIPVLQALWNNGFQFTKNCELNSCVDKAVVGNLPPALPVAQKAVGGDGLDRFIRLKLQPANGDAKLSMASLFEAYTGWAAQNGAGQFKDQGKFTAAFKKALKTRENESLYHDVIFCKATFPGYTNQISAVCGVTFRDTSCLG